MKRSWIIISVLFCALQMAASVQGKVRYRANILERIALAIDKTEKSFVANDSDIAHPLTYNGRGLCVMRSDGCIDHIGYAIFNDAQRKLIGNAACNFVERLALMADLPLKQERTMAQFVKEENIIFKKGDVTTLKTISPEKFTQIEYELLRERLHHIKWKANGQVVCDIAFPADHELLSGMGLPESESKVKSGVCSTRTTKVASRFFYPEEMVRKKGRNYWIKPGTKYFIDAMTSDRYYTCLNDTTYTPLHDARFPVESIFNILTDTDVESNVDVTVKMQQYPLSSEFFNVSLNKMVGFCVNEGCVGFVGLSDANSGNTVDCLLIMHNSAMGYNHVIRLKVNITDFDTMTGTAEARWNAYVPSSNIKDLFYDNVNGIEWKK